jgi:hypothetical protein
MAASAGVADFKEQGGGLVICHGHQLSNSSVLNQTQIYRPIAIPK